MSPAVARVRRAAARRRRARTLLVLATLAVAGWLAASLAVSYGLTRRPYPLRAEPGLSDVAPGEEWPWTAADGVSGSAWWSDVPESLRDGAPVAILLHGLGGTRREWASVLGGLRARGVATLSVTLRCHGGTEGEVHDFGRGAGLDLLAVVALVEERAPRRPIVVFGQSLGAAAALFAAPELGSRVARYVLEAPYPELSRAALRRTRLALGVGLGDLAALGLELVAPLFLEDPDGIAPARALARRGTGAGMVFLAGALDARAPLADVLRVAESVDPPVRVEVFDGARHSQCRPSDPARWWSVVDRELEAARRPAE